MKIIRQATEDEMLLSFLQGELVSDRFCKDIKSDLEKAGVGEELITNGDFTNSEENEKRKLVMKYFRGYPDSEIFTDYPLNAKWEYVEFSEEDLDNIYYVDYSYWNELSDGTSKPTDGARNVLAGKIVFDVPNDNFFAGLEHLKENSFRPLILVEKKKDRLEILEGHVRATVYGMCPEKFAGTCGFVGRRNDFKRKSKKT